VGSGIRLGTIFFGCATSNDFLGNITWSTWTATGANGAGTHNINNCHPDCAGGTYTRFPVEIQLTNPSNLDGMLVFKTATAAPSSSSGDVETSTVPQGSWGWIPS